MLVKDLEIKHPDWTRRQFEWQRLALLLEGGPDILASAALLLEKRPMEGGDVFATRCARMTYQNVLETALGWYGSRLFGGDKAPTFTFTEAHSDVAQPDFLAEFLEDCDGNDNSVLGQAQAEWYPRAVTFGHIYIYLDRRKVLDDAQSRLEQENAGVFQPYVASFDPIAATNWSTDQDGQLNWIIFRTERYETGLGKPAAKVTRWFYVDRTEFRIYEYAANAQDNIAPDKAEAAVVDQGRHALAAESMVPVLTLEMPKQLKFGKRCYPLILDHLNASNEEKWLHMQCCLAIPVITGGETIAADGEAKGPSQYSEVNLIELPKGGTFGWSEPGGVALEKAAERVATVMENIYRQMYLLAQARSVRSTPAAQSGASKYEDARASIEVLDGFGGVFRKFFRVLLGLAAIIADKPGTHVNVGGMKFDEPDALGELEIAQAALNMNVPSDDFQKLVYKRAVAPFLTGEPDKVKENILKQIDDAPTRSEQRAQGIADASAKLFTDQTTIFSGRGPVQPAPPSPPA